VPANAFPLLSALIRTGDNALKNLKTQLFIGKVFNRPRSIKIVRLATAYRIADKIVISSSNRTKTDLWITSDAVFESDLAQLDLFDEYIALALKNSISGVDHPVSWKELLRPVYKAFGIKNWSELVKSARCVEIESGISSVSLTPTVNLGRKEGFQALNERKLYVKHGAISDGLLKAFDLCE
jgi:hypothetical protein